MSKKSIFISYSREDSEFVLRLAKDLRKNGADIWLDQLDIEAGMRWDRAISKALGEADTLMIVLTQNAMDSDNVMDEVSFAFDEKKRIIPIMKEQCDVDFRLRRLQFTDFTQDYDTGLKALVKTLKLEASDSISESPLMKEKTGSQEHEISQPEDMKEVSATAKSAPSIAPIEAGIKDGKTEVNTKIETNTEVSNEALNQEIESTVTPGRAGSKKVSKPFWVRYKYRLFFFAIILLFMAAVFILGGQEQKDFFDNFGLNLVNLFVSALVLTFIFWLLNKIFGLLKKIFGSRKKSKT